MPWLETAPMEKRERFVRDHRLALYTMAELSARYGISRKTGYKWLDRFDQGGREGLGDRSRAPRRCPHKISDAVATLICGARRISRSEEHTSELQSRFDLVCRLLLEKKKNVQHCIPPKTQSLLRRMVQFH